MIAFNTALATLNNSKYFTGMMIILLNIGSRFV